MYVFIVQYTEEENNSFGVLKLQNEDQWNDFLYFQKMPDHLCGYLVTQPMDVRDVPFLQRQRYYESKTGTELASKEAGEEPFYQLLEQTAVDFNQDRLFELARIERRRKLGMSNAENGSAEGGAPRTRTRFTVDPNKIIILKVTENPRRKGSQTYEIFKCYRNGMTVEEALKTGKIRMIDIKADIERNHIELKDPGEAAVPPTTQASSAEQAPAAA